MTNPSAPQIRLATSDPEREAALALRFRVFCEEQGVDIDLEADGRDREALHVVAVSEGEVVGTCRLVMDDGTAKLGRMAVEPRERGRGVGAALLTGAEAEARAAGARRIALHAQTYAQALYARGGFQPSGEPFDEAGIEHVRMEKRLA